jgi:hypothetical protein
VFGPEEGDSGRWTGPRNACLRVTPSPKQRRDVIVLHALYSYVADKYAAVAVSGASDDISCPCSGEGSRLAVLAEMPPALLSVLTGRRNSRGFLR